MSGTEEAIATFKIGWRKWDGGQFARCAGAAQGGGNSICGYLLHILLLLPQFLQFELLHDLRPFLFVQDVGHTRELKQEAAPFGRL
jgi:hypothetical protein